MRNIMITGGAGFIGANFIDHYLTQHTNDIIINVDKLTYAGSLSNLHKSTDHPNYFFEQLDISDQPKIEEIFTKHKITDVIHFAAESHVDNSIEGPREFINTNILGTFTLLESARQFWMEKPQVYKKDFANSRFHHISTDEVYGTLGETGSFKETTPYAPNSPYSASKAGSDFIVRSYFHTYGMNVVTTNCSNNYGPKQHDEKLIPTIIRKALSINPIPIYGDGKNVRDWLYVEDHCKGIDLVFQKGKSGETYNIGGECEKNNNEVAAQICSLLDELNPRQDGKSYSELIEYVSDRHGHDRRYAINTSKISTNLGWKPFENFETGIHKTLNWYLEKYK